MYMHMPQMWYLKRGEIILIKTLSQFFFFFKTANEVQKALEQTVRWEQLSVWQLSTGILFQLGLQQEGNFHGRLPHVPIRIPVYFSCSVQALYSSNTSS